MKEKLNAVQLTLEQQSQAVQLQVTLVLGGVPEPPPPGVELDELLELLELLQLAIGKNQGGNYQPP